MYPNIILSNRLQVSRHNARGRVTPFRQPSLAASLQWMDATSIHISRYVTLPTVTTYTPATLIDSLLPVPYTHAAVRHGD